MPHRTPNSFHPRRHRKVERSTLKRLSVQFLGCNHAPTQHSFSKQGLSLQGNLGWKALRKTHEICLSARSACALLFFLIHWNYSGFTPLQTTAPFGLKSMSQPSRQILPQDREWEPSSINESLFSGSSGFCPWVKAHGAAAQHGHAEKGLEPGQPMAAGIQPAGADRSDLGGARLEGDGFFSTVGFTSHMEEGGGLGWKCKKNPTQPKKTPLNNSGQGFL